MPTKHARTHDILSRNSVYLGSQSLSLETTQWAGQWLCTMPDGLPTLDKHTKLLLRVVDMHRDRLGRALCIHKAPSLWH